MQNEDGGDSPVEQAPTPRAPRRTRTRTPAARAVEPVPVEEEAVSGEAPTVAVPPMPPITPPDAIPAPRVQLAIEQPEPAEPADAVARARSMAMDRLRAVGPGELVGLAAALAGLVVLVRTVRRRRSGGAG